MRNNKYTEIESFKLKLAVVKIDYFTVEITDFAFNSTHFPFKITIK